MGAVTTGKAFDQCLAELGFGAEMVEEGALGDTRRADHVIDRGRREAPEEHQPLGSIHNGALGLRPVLSQPSLLTNFRFEQTTWSADERVSHNTKSRRARKWSEEIKMQYVRIVTGFSVHLAFTKWLVRSVRKR